jgi:hypothetical protein
VQRADSKKRERQRLTVGGDGNDLASAAGWRRGGIERGCDVPVDVMSRTSDIDRREVRPTMTTAGHVRKVRGRPAAGQLPQDCPYCEETLENAPWGWVCARCHSTIGVEDAVAV